MKKHIKTAIIILLIIVVANLSKKLFFYGDYIERDNLVQATVWKLQEDGYTKDDIKSIKSTYNPLKGGVLPYEVFVIFKNNESRIEIYGWETSNKNTISHYGYTFPQK